jgi:hypothetical protein
MGRVSLYDQAPEVDLQDFNGIPFKLLQLKHKKNVLLIFNRGFS